MKMLNQVKLTFAPRIYFKAKDLEKFMERLEVAEC